MLVKTLEKGVLGSYIRLYLVAFESGLREIG
jgi:hypothetical protein